MAWGLAVLPFEGRAPRPAGLALFVLIAVVVIDRLPPHHPHARFGFGNGLTLVRAGGAVVFMALALEPGLLVGRLAWAALAGAALLLALDGIDGLVARQEGRASAFGARFDMEVDALLILALSVAAAGLGKAGPWVVSLGLIRYVFVLAGWIVPALARPLPPSRRRRLVCALQVAVLGLLLAPPVVPPLSSALAGRGLRRAPLVVRRRHRLAGTAPEVTGDLRRWGGLARSLVIYRARPWKIARLARLYGSFLAPGDLAFDIGAHAGNRTRALLRAGARVVALEPQRIFHDFLARDLPRDVTLLPLAAGAVPGTAAARGVAAAPDRLVARLRLPGAHARGAGLRRRALGHHRDRRGHHARRADRRARPAAVRQDRRRGRRGRGAGGARPAGRLAGLRGTCRRPPRPPTPASPGWPASAPTPSTWCRARPPPSRSTAGSTPTGSARELRRRAGDGRAGDVYARRQGGADG